MRCVRVVRSAGLLPLLGVLVVGGVWVLPAHAEDQTVRVTDGGFDPSALSVVAGDTITWHWLEENENRHSVRVDALEGPALEESAGPAYDSHPECSEETPGKCGGPGLVRTWSPTVAGTYTYSCRLHLSMAGTLTVEAAPSPEPSETASPSPSPSPTAGSADPEPSAEEQTDAGTDADGSDRSGSSSSTSDPSSGSSSSTSSSSNRTRGTASDPGITYGPPEPIEPEPLPTILPSVAPSRATPDVGEPDLEAFPEERQAGASGDDAGVIAVDAPPRGPSPRTVWLGIGSASILASAGAFVKLVLFGAPWP